MQQERIQNNIRLIGESNQKWFSIRIMLFGHSKFRPNLAGAWAVHHTSRLFFHVWQHQVANAFGWCGLTRANCATQFFVWFRFIRECVIDPIHLGFRCHSNHPTLLMALLIRQLKSDQSVGKNRFLDKRIGY